jgi:hypothetical protein
MLNLACILLLITAALTFSLGASLLVGSRHKNIGRLFFLAALCEALWAAGIAAFLMLRSDTFAIPVMQLYYIAAAGSGVFILLFALEYSGKLNWKRDVWLLLPYLAVATVIVFFPHLLFQEVHILAPAAQNDATLVKDGFYLLYQLYFITYFCAGMVVLARNAFSKAAGSVDRRRDLIMVGAWALAGVVGGTFNMILPGLGNYQLIWLGPLGLAPLTIIIYYVIIKMKLFNIKEQVVGLLSYVIVIMAAAGIYIVLFNLIWRYLFKIDEPSREIFVLNFIMAIIMLMLFPVLSSLNHYLNRVLYFNDISLSRLIKDLDRLANSSTTDLSRVANLLTKHLHLTSVGVVAYRPAYGGAKGEVKCGGKDIPPEELRQLAQATLSMKQRLIWRDEFEMETTGAWLGRRNIEVILRLTDSQGYMLGMLLLGPHKVHPRLTDRDVAPIMLVDGIIASMVERLTHERDHLPDERAEEDLKIDMLSL